MTRPAPEPPYPVELLAELHADNLPPEQADRLRTLVRQDPDAVAVLEALDSVTARLRDLGRDETSATPMPPHVAARLERAVAAAPMPAAAHPVTSITELRRRRSLRAVAVAAAAAVVVIAGTVTTVTLFRNSSTQPPMAAPTVTHAPPESSLDIPIGTLLAARDHHNVTGPLSDPATLRACLRAVGADRPVVGSLNLMYRGREAVAVLVPSVRPGKITALVVTPQCGPDNAQILARADF